MQFQQYPYQQASQQPGQQPAYSAAVPDATKPKFLETFSDLTVPEGEAATFQCQVTGSEPLTVRWFKDNSEITPNTPGYQIQANGGNYTFMVKRVTNSFAGKIMCILKNRYGNASFAAKLAVQS